MLNPKEKMDKRKSTPLIVIAILLLLVGTAALALPVLQTELAIQQDAEEYTAWRETFESPDVPTLTDSEESTDCTNDVESAFATFAESSNSSEGRTSIDLSACLAANADFIGWLQIPDTTVDYPVVQTDEVEYYLNYTFTGKKSYIGTLLSLGKTDFIMPSRNLAIYGHHIRSNDKVMFSPLLAYKDEPFYADHTTIYFDTLYHTGTYTIFAVLNMRNGDWEPSTADFISEQAYKDFIHRAKTQALYDTGVEVQPSDYILTLITCDRSFGGKDGRLVVMAVRQ